MGREFSHLTNMPQVDTGQRRTAGGARGRVTRMPSYVVTLRHVPGHGRFRGIVLRVLQCCEGMRFGIGSRICGRGCGRCE